MSLKVWMKRGAWRDDPILIATARYRLDMVADPLLRGLVGCVFSITLGFYWPMHQFVFPRPYQPAGWRRYSSATPLQQLVWRERRKLRAAW